MTVKSGYRKPPIGHFENSIHSTPVIIDDFVIAVKNRTPFKLLLYYIVVLNKTDHLRPMMDKLRRALSGNDGGDEERGFVAQVRKTNRLNSLKKKKKTCWSNSCPF